MLDGRSVREIFEKNEKKKSKKHGKTIKATEKGKSSHEDKIMITKQRYRLEVKIM